MFQVSLDGMFDPTPAEPHFSCNFGYGHQLSTTLTQSAESQHDDLDFITMEGVLFPLHFLLPDLLVYYSWWKLGQHVASVTLDLVIEHFWILSHQLGGDTRLDRILFGSLEIVFLGFVNGNILTTQIVRFILFLRKRRNL